MYSEHLRIGIGRSILANDCPTQTPGGDGSCPWYEPLEQPAESADTPTVIRSTRARRRRCANEVAGRIAPLAIVRTVFHYGKHRIEGDPCPGTRYVVELGRGHFVVQDWKVNEPHPITVSAKFNNEAAAVAALDTIPFT
ncbi:hypothetical protein [Sorangium sp. So ce854]|uniref:hypothetical protein n=1 Tax=Sorangium sp. So ce854 TaxID=3133322 RepID=UPI003F6485DE